MNAFITTLAALGLGLIGGPRWPWVERSARGGPPWVGLGRPVPIHDLRRGGSDLRGQRDPGRLPIAL